MNEAFASLILFLWKKHIEQAKICDKVDGQKEISNMKIFIRSIIKLSVLLGLFLCFGQTLFAQENKCDQPNLLEAKGLYQKYVDNHQSDDPEKLKIALESAKEYVGICESKILCNIDELRYFKDAIVALKSKIKSKFVASSQENQCKQITLDYLLTKLESASPETDSKEKIIKELKGEIVERKMISALSYANEKRLRSVGANDSLIKTIRKNLSKPSEEEISLYNSFITCYQSNNVEQTKKALEAAKEFVRKFENDGCHVELVKYFKEVIPVLETYIKNKDDIYDPVNPKTQLKWRLLEQVTENFKAENWDEVFALGRKVYEIDPEFVSLFTVLASIGFDQAKLCGSKSKYNAETVFYAELVVKLLEESKKDLRGYGAFEYNYKTKAEALEKMKEILDFMKNQAN